MYEALRIARYVIEYCNKKGEIITNLRLQKILFFIQAEFLVSKGISCFTEEIEAWAFGPVVPCVYRQYRIYGSSNIKIALGRKNDRFIDEEDKLIINQIVDECSHYSTTELVNITHAQTPWIKAYYNNHSNVISIDSIREYFENVS